MNEDIRISLDFWDHHKTIRLKKKIGYEGIEALTRLWFYAAKFRPRGHLTNMDNEDIAVAAHWNGDTQEFMNALTDSKHPWLDWYDDHYYIHNWHKRNPYASYSEKRSEIAKKAAEKRWNKKHNKKQKDNAVSNADFKEQQCSQQETAYAPIPIPIPNPYSKKNGFYNF